MATNQRSRAPLVAAALLLFTGCRNMPRRAGLCADAACDDAADAPLSDAVTEAPQTEAPDGGVATSAGTTDEGCGGTSATKCAAGKRCLAHADCETDACGYDGHCALARSCTAHFGGDTCGPGEVDDRLHRHESCCTSIPLADGGGRLDKYVITSGRMRAFVERLGGDVRTFVAGLGETSDWKQEWTARMPSNLDDVAIELGPYGADGQREGCWLKGKGARTYWQPSAVNAGFGDEIDQKYTKEILDTKALNCASFFMLQAFCIWDGGRLPTIEELDAQWGGPFPWGNQPWTPERAVHAWTYAWPEDQLDNTAFIAAPGRRPAGYGPHGHADLGGLLFNLTTTFNAKGKTRWSRNGSFEDHAIPYPPSFSPKERAYWAAGGRCARR